MLRIYCLNFLECLLGLVSSHFYYVHFPCALDFLQQFLPGGSRPPVSKVGYHDRGLQLQKVLILWKALGYLNRGSPNIL